MWARRALLRVPGAAQTDGDKCFYEVFCATERARGGGRKEKKSEESIRDRIDSFFCTPAKSVGGETISELEFSAKMSLGASERPGNFCLLNAIRGGQLDCIARDCREKWPVAARSVAQIKSRKGETKARPMAQRRR